MKESEVTYLTEDVPGKYAEDLNRCDSLWLLLNVLAEWAWIAKDALEKASEMNNVDFEEFKKGLKKERRGKYAGDTWAKKYGLILIPEEMLNISMLQERFKAPWGLCYRRYQEVNKTK